VIRIDGSYGEGGGQILRTALSLSACLKTPFEIYNIRKGRRRVGLLPQHLTSVNAVAKICNAEVSGATLNSTSLIFKPNNVEPGNYEFNVAEERGSAGAVTLVAQAILPVLTSTKSHVVLQGGTHVPFSPLYDYLSEVLVPYLKQHGISIDTKLVQYGFFPVGRGKVTIDFNINPKPKSLGSVLERGSLKKLKLISRVANLPIAIADRQRNQFISLLEKDFPMTKVETQTEVLRAACPGTYLFLKAEFEHITAGFCSLGERGKPAETVATEVYQDYKSYLLTKNCVFDYHLADQICIFLALSRFRTGNQAEPFIIKTDKMTQHLQTNIWLIRQFIPGFQPIVQVEG
jgi:RNA 3'-terminal phosphate cyclase (ATP)